jgi:imidazolonepropionase-like amidohydrolase
MHIARAFLTPAAAVCLVGALLWPETAAAQFDEPPRPAAYALQGVTVVGADGSRQPGVTIVVRRGFIDAIGTDVVIPPGTRLLEGDSLFVYPGIVDAQGEAEFEFPEPEVDRSELAFWAPPRVAQGFMPHRRVVDHLTATGSDLESQRSEGVVAAAVHPEGSLMPGRGAVLVFRPGAETPTGLVKQPELGPVMAFRGTSGMYPSTNFGAAAFLRQSLEDARHHGVLQAAHQQDPRGVKAPAWDPDYAVLRSVMTGRVPVYFAADRAADIQRVLELGEEYGFHPVIVGGGEAWRVADLLRERGVTVLVSLDFPEPERWEPDSEGEEESQEPIDAAAEREKQDIENRYANAGRLAAAGVSFALTSGGGDADLREGARKAIEYGLSEEAALRAVTTDPAALLDIEHITRVGAGYAATFIVTDGPLFDEDTGIRYTFVEGELEEREEADEGGEPPAVDVTGVWQVETSFGELTMTLTQEGAEVTGTMESQMGSAEIESGKVSGSDISLTISFDAGDETVEITYKGSVEGERMKGEMKTPFGDSDFTGRRVSGPGREE